MAQAVSISLGKFTKSVQAAVKTAAAKHTKFNNIGAPNGISVCYLIRGIPVPDAILANATLVETQLFANDVAAHIANANPGVFAAAKGPAPAGAVIGVGGHVIIGIPPVTETFRLEE